MEKQSEVYFYPDGGRWRWVVVEDKQHQNIIAQSSDQGYSRLTDAQRGFKRTMSCLIRGIFQETILKDERAAWFLKST